MIRVRLVIDLCGDPGSVEAVADSVISSISFKDLEVCDIEVQNSECENE